MTSKEALKEICENCHRNIQAQESKGWLPHKECPFRHISNDYCPEYEEVYKDLEVLEILKHNLFIDKGEGRFRGIEIICCSLGNQHSEDYNIVKEWLENGK